MTPERRVALYVRDPLPHGTDDRYRAVRERLDALADADVVDAIDVTAWGPAVPASGGRAELAEPARSALFAFEAWAARNDRDLGPGFAARERRPGGDVRRQVVLPVLCLAVYEDESLVAVYPSRNGDVLTVEDGLAALEAGTAGSGWVGVRPA